MRLDGLPGGARVWEVSGRRVVTRAAVAALLILVTADIAQYAIGGRYALDFHVGTLAAGSDVLHGRPPYPPADPRVLLAVIHAFVTPPPLAVLAVPFTLVPFSLALAAWYAVNVGATILALRVMGVRDLRIYLLALASYPLWDSLQNGQPDGLFALGAALVWCHRASWKGALAGGALIAAKLLAWPLLIWLLVTRRFRSLAVMVGSAVIVVLGSWATIGFQGLSGYPRLIAADARAFEAWPWSYSLVQAVKPLGLPIHETRILAVVIALGLALLIVGLARCSDEGWFAAALTFGVLCSPILWEHYLVVLFVPLALARRRPFALWLTFAYSSWLIVLVLHTSAQRSVAVILTIVAAVIWSTARPWPAARRVEENETTVGADSPRAIGSVSVQASPGVP